MATQPKQRVGSALYAAQTRRTNALAVQEEWKLLKIQGTLIDVAVAKEVLVSNNRAVTEAVLSLPTRVSGLMAAEQDQARCFTILSEECAQILTNLKTTLGGI